MAPQGQLCHSIETLGFTPELCVSCASVCACVFVCSCACVYGDGGGGGGGGGVVGCSASFDRAESCRGKFRLNRHEVVHLFLPSFNSSRLLLIERQRFAMKSRASLHRLVLSCHNTGCSCCSLCWSARDDVVSTRKLAHCAWMIRPNHVIRGSRQVSVCAT